MAIDQLCVARCAAETESNVSYSAKIPGCYSTTIAVTRRAARISADPRSRGRRCIDAVLSRRRSRSCLTLQVGATDHFWEVVEASHLSAGTPAVAATSEQTIESELYGLHSIAVLPVRRSRKAEPVPPLNRSARWSSRSLRDDGASVHASGAAKPGRVVGESRNSPFGG
jgi:hypothetical protein